MEKAENLLEKAKNIRNLLLPEIRPQNDLKTAGKGLFAAALSRRFLRNYLLALEAITQHFPSNFRKLLPFRQLAEFQG